MRSTESAEVLGEAMQTANLTVFAFIAFNVVTPDGPAHVTAARVSDSFFPLLGLRPAQGRPFRREEEAAGLNLAVISREFWSEQMAAIRLRSARS